jgi:hypothetical protein
MAQTARRRGGAGTRRQRRARAEGGTGRAQVTGEQQPATHAARRVEASRKAAERLRTLHAAIQVAEEIAAAQQAEAATAGAPVQHQGREMAAGAEQAEHSSADKTKQLTDLLNQLEL